MPLGLSPRDLLAVAREARQATPSAPLLVVGPLAPQLARVLTAGGDPGLVLTAGDPRHASALVCVLAGRPGAEQLTMLRRAARASTPTVAVQTGRSTGSVPYVSAGAVIVCAPGAGFPVDEISAALGRALGHEATALAARLPALRRAVVPLLVRRGSVRAAAVAAVPWLGQGRFPLLVLLQARMLRDVSRARGVAIPATPREVGLAVGAELAGPVGVGLAARRVYRSLPRRSLVAGAAISSVATYALGSAGARLGSRSLHPT